MSRLPVILFGLLLGLLPAQPASARHAPAAAWVPMLWEVHGDGDARLLLLGSTHLLQADDYPLPADVEAAYARAGRLVFEVDPVQMQSPVLARAMLAAGRRDDGRRLQDELPAAQWQALLDWAGKRGLPAQALQGSKAWLVALNVSLTEMAAGGLQAELGLDRQLMQRGGSDGRSMLGLEDAASQLALFNGLDSGQQQAMLEEALDDASAGGRRWRDLLAAWRSGDAARFWEQAGAPLASRHPALYRALNVQRNEAWLAQLPQWLADGQGTTLVVVGALHLVGDDGLVARLRAGGHRVERLCSVSGCPRREGWLRRR